MNRIENSISLILWSAFHINLFLLLLANRSAVWIHAATLLPWLWSLANKSIREQLIYIVKSEKSLIYASLMLSILIWAGCFFHECSPLEYESIFIPILWIPVAALTRSPYLDNYSSILITICAAIISIAIFVIWQFIVEKMPRPPAFSYNVLCSAILPALICAAGIHINTFKNNKLLTYLFYIAALLGIIGTIFTHAKTGLATFIIASIAYLISTTSKIKTLVITIPITIIWIFFISNKIQDIQTDINQYQVGQYRSSFGERTDALIWSKNHLFDTPITGMGGEQLREKFNQRWIEWQRPMLSTSPMVHLHNDYLQIALSKGFPALLCFAALWIGFIIEAITKHHAVRSWGLAFASIYITAFATDSFTYWNFAWAAVFASLGISIGLNSLNKNRNA